jgi:putative transcriptional regulator
MILYILQTIFYNQINIKSSLGSEAMLENRVREHRARLKWSQQDLANVVQVTRQTIGLIEKGDYAPSVALALKIAHAFRVPVEEVFSLKEEGE